MNDKIKKVDMHKKPIKTRWYLWPILYLLVSCSLIGCSYKIKKENFKKIKGGCLLLGTHMSFMDTKLLIKTIFPRRSYYVSSIDEFVYKEGLMRRLGCFPKKVHYTDMAITRNIVRLLKNGNLVTIFPEATYSFAGVPNMIDQGIGKLAKMANVPIIVLKQEGNYIRSPRWNVKPVNKKVPLRASAKMVVSKDELKTLSEEDILKRILDYFTYDEYKYQRDNNIHIKNKTMAFNIHRILYKCPHCLNEKTIIGKNNDIICTSCNAKYHIDELSILSNVNGESKFDSISKWYLWQKKFVIDDINNDKYAISFPVKISRLINCKKGFDHHYALGNATQNSQGIFIDWVENKTQEKGHYEYNCKANSTIHLTFDVRGCQESAFEVHNKDETYLIYPLDETPIVKIRFAVEQAHIKYVNSLKENNKV